jgi:acetyl coenzyme A synthetase (ADP forming)-like protein
MQRPLNFFFQPRSVAVIGSSRTPGKVGHDILSNLVRYGFQGQIFPINPSAEGDILGLKACHSILDVEVPVELAIMVTPPKTVLSVLDECSNKGVEAIIIISAGFKEGGPEGTKLEAEMVQKAKSLGIRVIGPNCLGVIDTYSNLNASFAADMPERGNISFISQSGAMCTAMLDWALSEKVGFSKLVSLGNKCDVDETDILEIFAEDKNTEVIIGYIEALSNGTRFMRAAKQISKKKPIIIAKSGRTILGARAASSHTGSLAGSNVAYETALWQSGIIRANTMEELIDYALAFSYQPIPKKPGLLIVTNAGGPGILAADAAGVSGVKLADFKDEVKVGLKSNLPPTASVDNPVDILGDAKADRYSMVLDKAMTSEAVGGVLILLTPQSTTQVEETAKAVAALSKTSKKPVMSSFMGKEGVASGLRLLQKSKIPNYPYPERAVFAFEKMYHYGSWQISPFALPEALDADRDRASSLFSLALIENRSHLRPNEVFEVFSCYNIRIPKILLAQDAKQAVEHAKAIGFPVVLKVASLQITHKSDVGGVRIGVRDEEAVSLAFDEIIQNCSAAAPEASIEGVTVQEMIEKGKELIVGAHRDPLFGPVIMFGLGGIYVETLQDVSFRIAPLTMEDTTMMMREIRSFPIIAGTRGEEPSDVGAVQKTILSVCQIMEDHPEVQEMDINPLKALPFGKGAVAVDGRIVLKMRPQEKGL